MCPNIHIICFSVRALGSFFSPKENLIIVLPFFKTSLVAQMGKHLPTMWETWVWSLGWEDPLEKEMATYSSTLAWRISWMEEPGGLKSMGLQRVRPDQATNTYYYFLIIRVTYIHKVIRKKQQMFIMKSTVSLARYTTILKWSNLKIIPDFLIKVFSSLKPHPLFPFSFSR